MNLFVKYSGARYYLLLHPVCGTEEQSGRGGDSYLVPATHRYKSSQDEVETATWYSQMKGVSTIGSHFNVLFPQEREIKVPIISFFMFHRSFKNSTFQRS